VLKLELGQKTIKDLKMSEEQNWDYSELDKAMIEWLEKKAKNKALIMKTAKGVYVNSGAIRTRPKNREKVDESLSQIEFDLN